MDSTQKISALEKMSYFSTLAMLFLAPLFFLPNAGLSLGYAKSTLFFVLFSLSFLLTLFSVFKGREVSLPRSLVLYFSGVLLVVYIISILSNTFGAQGSAPTISIVGHGFEITTLAFIFLMLAVTFFVADRFQSLKSLIFAHSIFLISTIVLGLFFVTRMIFGPHIFSFGVFDRLADSPVGSWNEIAIFFGLSALVALCALEVLKLRTRFWWLVFVSFLLSLAALVLVDFYLAWYVFGAAVLIVFLCQLRLNRSNRRLGLPVKFPYKTAVVLLLAIIFILPGSGRVIGAAVRSALPVDFLDVRPSASGTFEVAREAITAKPFFGPGPNQFANQWERYRPDINLSDFWNMPFSAGVGLIPTVFIETGFLGSAAWLLFLIFIVLLAAKAILAEPSNIWLRFNLTASALATLFLWTMSIIYVPSHTIIFLTFFFTGLFLASLSAADRLKTRSLSIPKFKKQGKKVRAAIFVTVLVILTVALLGSSFLVVKKTIAAIKFQKAISAFVLGDIETARSYVNQAISQDKNDIFYRNLVGLNIAEIKSIVSDFQAAGGSSISEENRAKLEALIVEAHEAAERATKVDPKNFENWLSFARIRAAMGALGVSGAFENANASFNNATELSPRNPNLFLEMARLEADRGNLAAAREFVEKSLELKNNYADAAFLLSQIDVSQGDISAAILNAEKIITLTPNDPAAFFRLGFLRYSQKNYPAASAALARAIELEPDYANARYFLGLSEFNLGRRADALTQFEELSKTNPGNAEVQFILSNLKAGRAPFTEVSPPLDDKPEKRSEPPISGSR